MCLYAVYITYTTLPYLQVWPNCKLSSSNGEMAGHDVFHKRYSSFSAVSSYLLHTSYSTTLCVCSVVSTSFLMIISFVMEKSLRSVRQMRYWAEEVWFEERKKIVPILIYLSLLFFWYLMSENQWCIKTTQETYQLGSILLY